MAFDCLRLHHQDISPLQDLPFDDVQYAASFDNLGGFYLPYRRTAPYGIFSMSDENCFDLLTGHVRLITTINLEALCRLFRQYDLLLEIPGRNESVRERYLSSSIADRKKMLPSLHFQVTDIKSGVTLDPEIVGLLFIEFVHEQTVVRACRALVNLLGSLSLPKDKEYGLYIGYGDESNLWT